ncbi:MAG: hypothetical protein HUJ61_00050 [Bacilli bacterium]|nr:hypothetical protein [Bacilli bacterium]
MRNNSKKIALLLLGAPLFMANSPAPRPVVEQYKNLEVSFVSCEYRSASNYYVAKIKVKNTGEGIVDGTDYVFLEKYNESKGYNETIKSFNLDIGAKVFRDRAIAPGEEDYFYTYSSTNWNENDLNEMGEFRAYAFSLIDNQCEVKFSSQLTFDSATENSYRYTVDSKIINPVIEYRSHSIVYTITYDGEDYSVITNPYNGYIETSFELDLTKAVVKEAVVVYQKKYVTSFERAMNVLVWIYKAVVIYYLFIILGVGGLIVAPAIVIPKLVRSSKRKAKARELEQKKKEEELNSPLNSSINEEENK